MKPERYPKTKAPFVRDDDGIVQDKIKEGFEWVFEKESVIAVEKLDGQNVAVTFNDQGEITGIYSREGDEKSVKKGDVEFFEGVSRAMELNWDEYLDEKVEYGELVGPRVKGNPYDLDKHFWVPFKRANEKLKFKSWGKYEKDYESISNWLNPDIFGLPPLFYSNRHGVDFETAKEEGYTEGIIFYDKETGKRAKIRTDMFPWR
jgi:hypothetical protein